jgi:3-(3-hydroxy-phenyl)propionate hydroxylase
MVRTPTPPPPVNGNGDRSHHQALVIGAGPVGLSAALALRTLGLSPTVLEADAQDAVRGGSRALFLHRESLKLLERMSPGLASEIAAYGLIWDTKRTIYGGRQVFSRTYPPPTPEAIPPFISLRQPDTEHHLRQACIKAGVEFIWSAPIKAACSTAEHAAVETEDGRRWDAEYIIAADGARSTVRRSLGIKMRGSRSQSVHVVVDLEEDTADPMPVERVFHYRHPALAGRNVLLIPFAGGWQIDLQCKPTDEPEELTTTDALSQWLPKVVDGKYRDRVAWVSTYRFQQVVAETFTDPHRRLLLAGEAAHLFAPFGARGMNSGIADADVAASAIVTARAATHTGRAHGAIEDFDRVRREAARYNEQAASSALAHLRPSSTIARVRQRVAAKLAPAVKPFGVWLDEAPYGPRMPPSSNPSGKY